MTGPSQFCFRPEPLHSMYLEPVQASAPATMLMGDVLSEIMAQPDVSLSKSFDGGVVTLPPVPVYMGHGPNEAPPDGLPPVGAMPPVAGVEPPCADTVPPSDDEGLVPP